MVVTARLRDSMMVVILFMAAAAACFVALADGVPWFARVLFLLLYAGSAAVLTFILGAEDFGT